MWLKVRGQGGGEELDLLDFTHSCRKLDRRLMGAGILAGALNVPKA